jgi:hypothetical protein
MWLSFFYLNLLVLHVWAYTILSEKSCCCETIRLANFETATDDMGHREEVPAYAQPVLVCTSSHPGQATFSFGPKPSGAGQWLLFYGISKGVTADLDYTHSLTATSSPGLTYFATLLDQTPLNMTFNISVAGGSYILPSIFLNHNFDTSSTKTSAIVGTVVVSFVILLGFISVVCRVPSVEE